MRIQECPPIISVVIPAFMSAGVLAELFGRLRAVLDSLKEEWEVIIIDDGSQDDTYEVMRSLRSADPRVKIMRLARNYGQHAATLCGLRQAGGDYIVTLDDDLQHPPEEIPKFIDKLKEGYHVVIGKYDLKKHCVMRNLTSRFACLVISAFHRKPRAIYWSSFKGFSRLSARDVSQYKAGRPFLAVLILDAVPLSSIVNIEVRHDIRRKGKSGYTVMKLLRLFSALLMPRRNSGADGRDGFVIAEQEGLPAFVNMK